MAIPAASGRSPCSHCLTAPAASAPDRPTSHWGPSTSSTGCRASQRNRWLPTHYAARTRRPSTRRSASEPRASVLVVISIPVLGAISDAYRRRKRWVVGFTLLSCVACAAMGILGETSLPVVGDQVLVGASAPVGWTPGIRELGWVLIAYTIAN